MLLASAQDLTPLTASSVTHAATTAITASLLLHLTTTPLVNTAESVIVSPDGRAMMLNKFGGVFEAFETPDGRFELNRTAKAWLGPGRPLGAAFDAQGNMIICDALKVCQGSSVQADELVSK